MKMFALAVMFVLAQGGGCANPNGGGVQTYGGIVGRVLDATDNRPVPNALISVGSLYTAYSGPDGAFTLTNIPIGQQPLTVSAPGYGSNSVTVTVHKDQTADAGYVRILPLTGGATAPPPPTPVPATPNPTPIPALTPTPAASASSAA